MLAIKLIDYFTFISATSKIVEQVVAVQRRMVVVKYTANTHLHIQMISRKA